MRQVSRLKRHTGFARWSMLSALALAGWGVAAFAQEGGVAPSGEAVTLTKDDQKITTSVKIAPGVHRVADAAGDGAILIQGDDLVVDFQDAELIGCTDAQQPDEYTGKGLVLRGRNITLRNAKVRGYKVGIYAEN
ncbi:MAG: hypothetical protein RBU25_18250, partial [Lentisphaeria bacterium]|nr:hypothetical protein [Lentisphaeria bacterium]